MTERIPKIIAWDMDETLGNFDRIYADIKGWEVSILRKDIELRAGIKNVLSNLHKLGFENWIVSGTDENLVKEVLQRTNLDQQFGENIWPNDLLHDNRSLRGGKAYASFEESMFFNDRTQSIYRNRMIVVGDAPGDAPGDLDQLVFIQDRSLATSKPYSGVLIEKIIKALYAKGKESFYDGFCGLFLNNSQIEGVRKGRIDIPSGTVITNIIEKQVRLDRDIRFSMVGEIPDGSNKIMFPMITRIEAPRYRKELEKVLF